VPEPELHSVRLIGMSSATVVCDECVYHADTYSAAELPVVLGNAAMHAMALGHVVHEHITRDITVTPDL
jgi:hypothetical protein